MNASIVAIIIQEGSKLVSEFIRNRPLKQRRITEQRVAVVGKTEGEIGEHILKGKASSTEAGCIPCSLGHFSTCTGILNEAVRFKKEGIESPEIIDRVGMCVDELNALERVDLRPEMIAELPEWEKKIASEALAKSRAIRHNLTELSNIDTLERVAAETQTTRKELSRKWFQQRLAKMSKEEKAKVTEKAIEKLEQEEGMDLATRKQLEDLKAMREASRIKG